MVRLESAQAVARTHESIRYGESLMDALELCDAFKAEILDYMTEVEIAGKSKRAQTPVKPQPGIKFLGKNIFEYMQWQLQKVRPAELENTLRFLNQPQSFSLLYYLEHMMRHRIEPELVARCTVYIVKNYQVPLR